MVITKGYDITNGEDITKGYDSIMRSYRREREGD